MTKKSATPKTDTVAISNDTPIVEPIVESVMTTTDPVVEPVPDDIVLPDVTAISTFILPRLVPVSKTKMINLMTVSEITFEDAKHHITIVTQKGEILEVYDPFASEVLEYLEMDWEDGDESTPA